MDFAAACLPHPAKAESGGEDSYFACDSSRSFGVADGVGGWAEAGVDPGLFARRLLKYAHEDIHKTLPVKEVDLEHVLWAADLRIREEQLQGGTTALLGQLTGSTAAVLNLGDSGVIFLRPALRTPPGSTSPLLFPRILFRSSDQTHYFNCPYQLGSSKACAEVPDLFRVRVRAGDLILAATDGIFDNLFDHQLQALVAHHLGAVWRGGVEVQPQLQALAEGVTRKAQRIGKQQDNKDVITPFALAAHSEGLNFRGGKLDDATVVVGLVAAHEDGVAEDKQIGLLHNF